MGVRTAERMTGVSVFMADLQIGLQRSEAFIIARRGGRRRRGIGKRRCRRKTWAGAARPSATLAARPGRTFLCQVLRISGAPLQGLSLIRGGLGLHFVGARAVETRDGDIQE